MAPAGDSTPLSLRPFPVADKKPKNLADFIGRVNAQPGGFRSLSEAKLREEAAKKAQGATDADDDDVDMSEGEDDDEDAQQDPNQARLEVLRNIEIAGNTALLTLDSLSLLLSKQNPSQAGLTLSKQLREVVGIGTLGADRLDESNITEEKEKDRESVASGWTLMEIEKTRESAEAASTFLQDEVESESRYWEDIVGVQKHGWSICKMPQERHTLGVRFGFSEATPEFRNMGLAPMRRDDDGSVKLDNGALGGISERLVVTIEREGKLVGRSAIPTRTESDAPLEERVLDARNTLFDQELWYELSREARTLAAYEVKPQASSLTWDVDENTKMTVELLSLDSAPAPDPSLAENDQAEAVLLALHILLSYAHRHNELVRIRPLPPHIPRSKGQQPCALLRPIIARAICQRNLTSSTQYVGALTKTFQKAGFQSSFTLQTAQTSIPDTAAQGPNQISAAQLLVRSMLQPPAFSIHLTILSDTSLTIRSRTYLYPVTATYYQISLPPSSPLETLCPPHKDGYTDLQSLADYLCAATTRLVTEYFLNKLTGNYWVKNVQGTSIRHIEHEEWEIKFEVADETPSGGKETGDHDGDESVPRPYLKFQHCNYSDLENRSKTFTWRGHDEASSVPTLDSMFEKIADLAKPF